MYADDATQILDDMSKLVSDEARATVRSERPAGVFALD
jgi:hypothetical protein